MAKMFPLKSKGFNPFGELIGLDFNQCETGYSRCELEIQEKLLNPHRVVHGGVIYSMVDTGMGGALYTYLAPDELCTTIEIKIIYLYATSAGRLICETRVIQRSKRIAVLESEVKHNSTLIAKATGTFYIFKSKGEGEDQRESKPSDLP